MTSDAFPENSMPQSINRRQLLIGAGAAAAWAAMGTARRAVAAAPKALIHETKVISHQPELYHGWPTVARRRSGELLLVYSGGRERHVCPFGRLELMRSRDEGKTWSWPCVILDPGIDTRDAGILETAKGTLLATTFTSLAYADRLAAEEKRAAAGKPGAWSAEHLDRWRAAHNRLDAAQRKVALGVWMVRSADGGLTWSPPYDCRVDSPHGPIQLSDGRLLYAGKDLWRTEKAGVCESADDGQTWHWLAEIPARPGDDPAKHYHELHAVETGDGRIVVQIRNESKQNWCETLQTESADGGKTWTVPHSIGVWGLPSHLLEIKDGRLLMTYGYRRPPFGNQARVSGDQGRNWSEPMTISSDGVVIDLGYPSTVQLADGSLLTVWYERMKDSPRAVLRQAHWSLESR
jgi:sialidase-1